MHVAYKTDTKYRKMKGRFSEALVEHLLIKDNYKIIKKNYYCIEGEVDIVISKGLLIIFVEVKAWDNYADDELALVISEAKLNRMKSCVEHFLNDMQDHEDSHTWMCVRMDVILVKILHYEMVHYKGV